MMPSHRRIRRVAFACVLALGGVLACQKQLSLSVQDLAWRNTSLVPASLLGGQLAPSDDLWIGQDEAVTMAWEAVVTLRDDSNGRIYRLAGCTGFDADTGHDLGFQ